MGVLGQAAQTQAVLTSLDRSQAPRMDTLLLLAGGYSNNSQGFLGGISRLLAQLPPCSKPMCGCCTSNSHNCCTAQHQNLGTIRSSGPSQQCASRQALTPSMPQGGLGGGGAGLPPFWHPDLCSRSLGSATISHPHPCCMLTCTLEVALSPYQVARGIAAVGILIPPWDLEFVLPRVG